MDDLTPPPAPSTPEPPPGGVIIEPSRIDPQTEQNQPDKGTKLFVLFFFLIVPPLGIILLAAVCWMLFKRLMAA